jgi:hypothetical protein
MAQTLKRPLLALVAVGVIAAVASSAALAATGHGRFGARATVFRAGFGGGPGPFGHGFGAFLGPGPGGPGIGIRIGAGDGPRGGGAGVLIADVLTPAASYLGISVSTLTSDLNGGKTLAQEATAKGKTASGLIDALTAAQKTVLDNEKAAGWITDAQATALLSGFTMEVTNLVNNGPPVPPTQKQGQAGPLQTAATYLGISVSQLQSDLQSGKTLADVATANGKTVDGLVAALTAPAKTKLDASVAAGDITAAQEATILANLTKHVTDFVNNAKLGAHTATTRLQAFLRR